MQKLGLGSILHIDNCRKYFPKYSKDDFLQEIQHTDGQILKYLPQKNRQITKDFQRYGLIFNVIFWTLDMSAVIFCHKIKLLSRFLGVKTWKMFIFKIALVGFPYIFMNNIEISAKQIHYEELYKQISKLYRRYKRTGDIQDLNYEVILEQNQTSIQKIINANKFSLLHQELNQKSKVL